jgi:putative addiction module component (TIGR02574 family)
MIGHAEIRQMPFAEKLALLEVLWSDLASEPDRVEIPEWHKDILDERTRACESGAVESIDWEVAKEEIRKRIP